MSHVAECIKCKYQNECVIEIRTGAPNTVYL